jgi:hypothetical protein
LPVRFLQVTHLSPEGAAFTATRGDISAQRAHFALKPLHRGLKLGHFLVVLLSFPFPGIATMNQFSQSLLKGFKLLTTMNGFGFPLT